MPSRSPSAATAAADPRRARLRPRLIPVDEILPALNLDHPRADIRSLYPKRLRAYALEPPLVTQLPKEEAGSDTEASANAGERNPHPDVTLPGGGITPGPLVEQASAAAVSPGAASAGSAGNVGVPAASADRSRKSVTSLALASR